MNAREAATDFGVELSDHRSRVISEEMVQQADVVLVFDDENLEEIRFAYPWAKSKTFMLGVMNDSAAMEITDPYGGTAEEFRRVYEEIRNAIDLLESSTRNP